MNLLQQLGWKVAPQWVVSQPPPPPAPSQPPPIDNYNAKVKRVCIYLDGWDSLIEAGQKKRGTINITKFLAHMDAEYNVKQYHVWEILPQLSQSTLRKWFLEKSLKEYKLWRNG